jgi:hypothetical protein
MLLHILLMFYSFFMRSGSRRAFAVFASILTVFNVSNIGEHIFIRFVYSCSSVCPKREKIYITRKPRCRKISDSYIFYFIDFYTYFQHVILSRPKEAIIKPILFEFQLLIIFSISGNFFINQLFKFIEVNVHFKIMKNMQYQISK